MNPSLSLLLVPDDWQKYQMMFAQAGGFHPNQVNWGKGPAAYPCLVAAFSEKSSTLLHAKKVTCCYVYVPDAQKLLESAVSSGGALVPDHGQDTFNKAMMAHVMTLIELLVDTGIVKEDQYEQRFTKMLARTDQLSAEDLEKAWRQRNEPSEPSGPDVDYYEDEDDDE